MTAFLDSVTLSDPANDFVLLFKFLPRIVSNMGYIDNIGYTNPNPNQKGAFCLRTWVCQREGKQLDFRQNVTWCSLGTWKLP